MKILLLALASMLLLLTTSARSEPPATSPATQPSVFAALRAAALKKNLTDFSLNLDLCGSPADRPEYTRLILSVTMQERSKWLHGWLESSITEAEAGRIIDYLATEGFLDQAVPKPSAFKWPAGPCYVLSVPGLYQDLGWDLTMLRRLEALRKILTGDAAKSMDLILTSLAKQREEWTKSAATTAPRADMSPAPDAFQMSYVFPLTSIDIDGTQFKYGWSVAKDNSSPAGNPGDYIGRAVYGTLTPAQQARAKVLAQRLLALDAPAGDSFPPADPKSYPAAFHGSLKVLVGTTTRTILWTGDSKVPPELDTIVHDLEALAKEARPAAEKAHPAPNPAERAAVEAVKESLQKLSTDLAFLEPDAHAANAGQENVPPEALKPHYLVLDDQAGKIGGMGEQGAVIYWRYNLTPAAKAFPPKPLVDSLPGMIISVHVALDDGALHQVKFAFPPITFAWDGQSTVDAWRIGTRWIVSVNVAGNRPEQIKKTHDLIDATLNHLRPILEAASATAPASGQAASAAEAWTSILTALQATDKAALAKVTTAKGYNSIMAVYGPTKVLSREEMHSLARAWGRWELRFTVQNEDSAHANAGPPVKEAGLDFIKTAQGWKLDLFTPGE